MKGIIFDLDGTLINSLTDIALCMNEVLQQMQLPTHDIQQYNYFVGDGAWVLSQNVLPKNSQEHLVKEVFERFKKLYDENIYENTKPYDGIYELLQQLEQHSFKLGILSNKPHEFTLKYAKKFFSEYAFEEIHGQKKEAMKKPHPAGALHIAQAFGLQSQEIFYIGDTSTDMKTAYNAKMKSIGVTWGFRPKEELIEHGAHYIAHTPQEIFEIVMSTSD